MKGNLGVLLGSHRVCTHAADDSDQQAWLCRVLSAVCEAWVIFFEDPPFFELGPAESTFENHMGQGFLLLTL